MSEIQAGSASALAEYNSIIVTGPGRSSLPEMSGEEYASAFECGYLLTFRFLVSRGAPTDAAEEIAQAAWAKGWELRRQLQNPTRVGIWVNSIAKNMFRNHFRSSQRVEALSDTAGSRTTELDTLEVDGILSKCRGKDRAMLSRHYLEGYTTEEIAEQIGLTPSAVRVRLLRIRRSLNEVLRLPGGGDGRRRCPRRSAASSLQ